MTASQKHRHRASTPPQVQHPLGQIIETTLFAGVAMLSPAMRADLRKLLATGVADIKGGLGPIPNGEEPDLYYTLFAQWLCRALEMPADTLPLRSMLTNQPIQTLDPLRRACHSYLSLSLHPTPLQRLRHWCHLPRNLLAGFRSPEILFITILSLEECHVAPWWFALTWWAPWNPDTTPRAAAAVILQAMAGAALNRGQQAQRWLLDQQITTGGFRNSPAVAEADLRSTARARFALALTNWRATDAETENLIAFIEACRTPQGLWAKQPGMMTGDVERTFDALLALGSSSISNSDTDRTTPFF